MFLSLLIAGSRLVPTPMSAGGVFRRFRRVDTFYVNAASSGGDGTTQALSGVNAAFASLRAAMQSFGFGTLSAPTEIVCEGSTADTLAVYQPHFAFKTTSTNYLTIRGNNTSGKYDTSKYRLEISDSKALYNNNLGHCRMYNLQVQITATTSVGNTYECFRLATANNENGPVDHRYYNCIAKMVVSGTDNVFGFIDSDPTSGGQCLRVNCIAYGGYCGFNSAWTAGVKNYNCTSYGNEYNYIDPQVCVNCISAAHTAESGFLGTGTTGHFNNASSDATAGGTNARTNQTFSFVDTAGGDFHLQAGDTGARGFGLSDPLSGGYLDDIDGDTRTGSWDIGADQFDSGGSGPIRLRRPDMLAALLTYPFAVEQPRQERAILHRDHHLYRRDRIGQARAQLAVDPRRVFDEPRFGDVVGAVWRDARVSQQPRQDHRTALYQNTWRRV